MSHPTPNWHPYGHTHADNLALLAAGDETGWYDETGRPAPWPDNFLDPDAGWTSATTHEPRHAAADENPHNPF